MSMRKYLIYIEKSTKELAEPYLGSSSGIIKKKLFYAMIMIDSACPATNGAKSRLRFEVSDNRLENIYSTENFNENKIICSLKWINTRNEFSLHILKSLLDYQTEYWFSGKEIDLKPLTFKHFLSLYPFQYLDQTRLSRLIKNLLVMSPHGQLIYLKNLFISKKNIMHFLLRI